MPGLLPSSPLDFLTDNNLQFHNPDLIVMALTHPSYCQESNYPGNNQRLEFLGDAVLNLAVAEFLYRNYGDKPEGELTKIRAKVVSEKSLFALANKLNLGKYILLGKGEEMSGGRTRKSILADAVEAIIGAIYLDQGFNSTATFIYTHLESFINLVVQGDYQDYKSKLQEIVQGKNRENVSYTIIEESGPPHCKMFIVGLVYDGKILATGKGTSKKEAEQNAAGKVLRDPTFLSSIGYNESAKLR